MAIIDRARHGEPVPRELPADLIESVMKAAESPTEVEKKKSKKRVEEPKAEPDLLGLLDLPVESKPAPKLPEME